MLHKESNQDAYENFNDGFFRKTLAWDKWAKNDEYSKVWTYSKGLRVFFKYVLKIFFKIVFSL